MHVTSGHIKWDEEFPCKNPSKTKSSKETTCKASNSIGRPPQTTEEIISQGGCYIVNIKNTLVFETEVLKRGLPVEQFKN